MKQLGCKKSLFQAHIAGFPSSEMRMIKKLLTSGNADQTGEITLHTCDVCLAEQNQVHS